MDNEIILEDWVSVTEYAQLTGKTPQAVRALCEKGLLDAVQPDGGGSHWRIRLSSPNSVPRAEYEKILVENANLKLKLNTISELLKI